VSGVPLNGKGVEIILVVEAGAIRIPLVEFGTECSCSVSFAGVYEVEAVLGAVAPVIDNFHDVDFRRPLLVMRV
jgi:hypothetical protein